MTIQQNCICNDCGERIPWDSDGAVTIEYSRGINPDRVPDVTLHLCSDCVENVNDAIPAGYAPDDD